MAKRNPRLSTQILEEASSWFIDFSEGEVDGDGREEFNNWLRRSPEHVRAYLQITAFWEDARTLKNQADVNDVVARAMAEQNVYPLDREPPSAEARSAAGLAKAGPPAHGPGMAHRPRQVRWAGAPYRFFGLAATFSLLALGAVGAWHIVQHDTYATDIGEQRSFVLEDGSSVELNSRSRLKVNFTADKRSIELLAGQALFRVAKNPARPFIVTTGTTSVRAVGTQFDVYRKKSGTVVTVLEGTVAIASQQADSTAHKSAGQTAVAGSAISVDGEALRDDESLFLTAGQQLAITAAAAPRPQPANIAIATAWTEKKLIFESAPLREVVEEFNRYNRQQLVIRDPELYDFHVSGVFASTDSGRMVEFLRQRFGVTMDRSGEQIAISRRAAPGT